MDSANEYVDVTHKNDAQNIENWFIFKKQIIVNLKRKVSDHIFSSFFFFISWLNYDKA